MKVDSVWLILVLASFVVSFTANATLAYTLIDRALWLDDPLRRVEKCEVHRDVLDDVLRDVGAPPELLGRSPSEVSFQFDASGRYSGSWYRSSATSGIQHDQSEPAPRRQDGRRPDGEPE